MGLNGTNRGLTGLNWENGVKKGHQLFFASSKRRTFLIPEWSLVDFELKQSRFTCIGDSHESPEHQSKNLGGYSKIPE